MIEQSVVSQIRECVRVPSCPAADMAAFLLRLEWDMRDQGHVFNTAKVLAVLYPGLQVSRVLLGGLDSSLPEREI